MKINNNNDSFENECSAGVKPILANRYDSLIFKPPFRVGKKQGKAVLDANGLLVTFMTSDVQANLFCDYLNNVC